MSMNVPSEKATEYAKTLVRSGMSATDIAEKSGVAKRKVQRILSGTQPMISWVTEEAILGVPVPEGRYMPKTDGLVDATPSRRRLQALAVQGFPVSYVAREVDMVKPALVDLRSGARGNTLVSCSVKIRLVHEELWDADPLALGIPPRSVNTAKSCAQRNGWFPTEAWADIDDPACEPIAKTAPKYVRTAEDFNELTERFGLNRRQAAERLGMSVDAVNAALGYYKKRMASAS